MARPEQQPAAVLFDRDATLIVDVPYNGDPDRVAPMPTAAEAVAAVRAAGIPIGIVSNQSGIARGLITAAQAEAVTARTAELLGGFDTVQHCPHGPDDGCACRKPRPGMVLAAAAALGVDPAEVVVIGDIGADLGAAHAVGGRGVLVPTPVTRQAEIDAAGAIAPDLLSAVRIALAGGAA